MQICFSPSLAVLFNKLKHQFKYFVEEYYKAYLLIKRNKPSPVDFFFVKSFLLGRAIELILKTELLIKNHTVREIRKKGGHDLYKLLQLLDFPTDYSIDQTTADAIMTLGNYYNDKNYEYPPNKDVEIKNTVFLEDFIRLSLTKINFHLNKKF